MTLLTQGLVVSGFADLPSGVAMFLEFDWTENRPLERVTPGKGAWLGMLNDVAPISDADGKDTRAAALAFTWTGLQKIGLGDDALATFSAPFREGMYQEDRLRRLGDRVKNNGRQPSSRKGRAGAPTPRSERTMPRACPGTVQKSPTNSRLQHRRRCMRCCCFTKGRGDGQELGGGGRGPAHTAQGDGRSSAAA